MAARPSLPHKHRWHGIETVDPNFYFAFENFAFTGDGIQETRQRPKQAMGAIWHVGGEPRDDLFPLADIRQNGSLSSLHTTFSVGGHLIAKMLTGLDEPENLVPVTKATNDKMQKVENELKGCANPHWLVVEVQDYFDGPDQDPRVPRSFRYSVSAGGQRPSGDAKPLKTWSVVQDWIQVGSFSFPPELIKLVKQFRTGIKLGWKIESVQEAGPQRRSLTFLDGHLPPLKQRPLAFLDYMLIAYPGYAGAFGISSEQIQQYIGSIGLKKSFELKWVRDLAIVGNVLANDNWLISDVYGRPDAVIERGEGIVTEPHRNLIVGSGANAPQVDHILPESLDGPNCFSNAQITSQQYNSQKGNATQTLQFRSDAWKQDMAEKIKTDPMIKFH